MDISKAGGGAALSNPVADAQKTGTGGAGSAGGKFADVLSQGGGPGGPQAHQPQGASPFSAPILDPGLSTSKVGPTRKGIEQTRQVEQAGRRVELVGERAGNPPGGVGGPVDASGKASGPAWQRLAMDTSKAENKMDAMIAAARNGKAFSASELLALQVEVFRYSQTVEVISKSTDKLVGAVKQTLGTQV